MTMVSLPSWVVVCSRCGAESGPPSGSVTNAVCCAEQAGWLTAVGTELCPACVCAGGDEILAAPERIRRTANGEAA